MAHPAIVWRNPKPINRRRLWNCARRDEMSSLYVVVRSGERASVWEGLPNLELLDGGAPSAKQIANLSARSSR